MEGCKLVCSRCGTVQPSLQASCCQACGGIVTVAYSPHVLKMDGTSKGEGIFAHAGMLPPVAPEHRVTLLEGNTPLVKAQRLSQQLGVEAIFLKDESKNPTGSFKDRPLSVSFSVAKELGCNKIVVASSGNGAASAAAYAAKSGITCQLFVPEQTPEGKLVQAMTYGAYVQRVPGNFTQSFLAAKEAANEPGVLNLTTTFLAPFGVEGDKTIALELYAQMPRLPDWVFIPVGAGPVLYGIYKGFCELQELGYIQKLPHLAAVQAAGCAPIYQAWKDHTPTQAWAEPSTVASAICDPLLGYEDNGDLTVSAIVASEGAAFAVTDEEIMQAGRLLASGEGVFAEPASAAAFAGLCQAKATGQLQEHHCAVCVITGSGLKDPAAYLHH